MLNAFVTAAAEETQSPVLPALPDLVWGSLAFAIVLAFFLWKVLPSMNAMLDARREAIEGGIKRAEEMQSRATAALEEYTAKLAEARTEAAQIRDQARADGAKILAELRENAQAEAARVTASAQAQIAAERQSALVSLRTDVGSLAIDLAGGVIGESLSDDAKAKAVVDRFIAELETAQTAGKA
ncbi:MAG: F0F1 ATP synthase subunit B [Microbacterium sp.]|uniref:F0F1 ATP synthase subunit B n=1 Tax=Microbacterium sp. TaxID=51671 RepID=UPI00092AED39|nr:F0F1 ATP synthase subunit B [Microbacterium sp.]OJU56846.1 MAG: F0F1 ATP synthase subunit B [Microbacterium sp. 70-38]MBN9154334.1 F0F1 ATP synthase subunit B [Microbacterium sp.]MBN9175265.1 F0F1 ATP synthase subunit B [Microbacterium sp.]MBN9183568.1 F0F1 ATP synthase subunit B [Microbacterium sp.]MBN9185342.1 F0F1 ATP synthase subunit B [Microbacterium sp.]